MIRNRRKVKELVNLERNVCSDEVPASAGFRHLNVRLRASRYGGNVVPASRFGLTYTIQMRWEPTVGEDKPMRGGTGNDFPGQVFMMRKDSVNVHEIPTGSER